MTAVNSSNKQGDSLLAGVLDTQRDALYGGLERLQQTIVFPPSVPPAFQKVNLQQVQWVNIRIPETDIALQNSLVVQ